VSKYLSPREGYATRLYEAILRDGSTTGAKCSLYGSALQEAKEEFRDFPWKYGNKALICSDTYVGTYKFAETPAEIGYHIGMNLKHISTREGRGLRVMGAYKQEYGSNRDLDHVIRAIQYSYENNIYLTQSGLYITG
jgi:hypothetical protein